MKDFKCPCDKVWHVDRNTNCYALCEKLIACVYCGMVISFRVKPGDVRKFCDILAANGATHIEVGGGGDDR